MEGNFLSYGSWPTILLYTRMGPPTPVGWGRSDLLRPSSWTTTMETLDEPYGQSTWYQGSPWTSFDLHRSDWTTQLTFTHFRLTRTIYQNGKNIPHLDIDDKIVNKTLSGKTVLYSIFSLSNYFFIHRLKTKSSYNHYLHTKCLDDFDVVTDEVFKH